MQPGYPVLPATWQRSHCELRYLKYTPKSANFQSEIA